MAADTDDTFADDPKRPYGDVTYADPGVQSDGKKRYPVDTVEHVRAAWSYINQQDNASKYSDEQLEQIRGRIKAAAKKLGITISDEAAIEFSMQSDTGYPVVPPADWFTDPQLDAKTRLKVTPEGRVYGHLAAWGECHRDVAMRECVLAPRSHKGYAPFHLGEVMVDDGSTIRVGKIVMDTRHADIRLGYSTAALHYDDTGDEVAVVCAGEDDFGIWVAGALVPETTHRKAAKLRRSPLSGDWRAVDGHLELTAALAVNVPAFPVYALDGDDQLALVAAGTVYPIDEDEDAGTVDVPNLFALIKEAVMSELAAERDQDELAWELRELDEEDQGELAAELGDLFAADGQPMDAGDEALFSDEAVMARQADAQFAVTEEPEGASSAEEEPAQVPPEPAPGTSDAAQPTAVA